MKPTHLFLDLEPDSVSIDFIYPTRSRLMKIRQHLESLPPYTPIEPFEVLSARLGREP